MTGLPRPTLTVIAGSNGAGKSTLTSIMRLPTGVPVLDPDAMARAIRPSAPQDAAMQAAREVLRRQRQYVANGESFAVETTLAGQAILRHMDDTRQQGFAVHLIYIGVETVQIAIDRIAIRVAKGGHDIPDTDIRRRYGRSMSHLRVAVEIADQATVIDNTTEVGPREVVALEQGVITRRAAEMPRWVRTALGDLLSRDETEQA